MAILNVSEFAKEAYQSLVKCDIKNNVVDIIPSRKSNGSGEDSVLREVAYSIATSSKAEDGAKYENVEQPQRAQLVAAAMVSDTVTGDEAIIETNHFKHIKNILARALLSSSHAEVESCKLMIGDLMYVGAIEYGYHIGAIKDALDWANERVRGEQDAVSEDLAEGAE